MLDLDKLLISQSEYDVYACWLIGMYYWRGKRYRWTRQQYGAHMRTLKQNVIQLVGEERAKEILP